MYFVDERKSYDVPVVSGLANSHSSVKKETITEEFDAKEFIPIEYYDSDEDICLESNGPVEP
jgi:hypothetical protein